MKGKLNAINAWLGKGKLKELKAREVKVSLVK